MVFTAKQQRAIQDAMPAAKAALRAAYNLQNRGQVPGTDRDTKQRRAANNRARARQRGNPMALQNMPRGAAGPRGVMPDATGYHWDQTPASSNVIAPRGFGYYDAFTHSPSDAVTAFSVGPATPVQANTRASVTTKATNGSGASDLGVQILIVYPSASDIQAKLYECGASATVPSVTTEFTSPQLATGGPEAVMSTRCSLQIRNITQVLNQGGVVRSLRVTTGIIEPNVIGVGTTQDLLDLAEHVRNHARTRSYAGADLVENKQINSTVVDQARATTFLDFGVYVPNDELPWYPEATPPVAGAVSPFAVGLHNPTYTPIILLFESFSTNRDGNVYEISIRTQFLAHYVQGSMLANLAVTPPSVGEKLNPHRDHEEQKGSVLHDVEEALRHAGNWAMNHGAEILGGIGAARFALPRLGQALGAGAKFAPMLL